ncbi:MAG: hypothetical protein IMX00_02425 [Limnochordales bacterium]|nr:hypothetical protein [Limnochordales bacterium]
MRPETRGESIEVVPVVDAFRAAQSPGELCPLCRPEMRAEANALEHLLGEKLMDPAFRHRVEKEGVCRTHFLRLLQGTDRLGLAILLQALVSQAARTTMTPAATSPTSAKPATNDTPFVRLRALFCPAAANYTNPAVHCIVCADVEAAVRQYCQTAAKLYGTKSDFRELFRNVRMICLPHSRMLLAEARQELRSYELAEFMQFIKSSTKRRLERIGSQLETFIKNFDYQAAPGSRQEVASAIREALHILTGRTD